MESSELADRVVEAAASLEDNRIETACSELIVCLRSGDRAPDPVVARNVLDALRKHRHMGALKRMADHLVRLGTQEDLVYRQYSQALIESGELIPAIEMPPMTHAAMMLSS